MKKVLAAVLLICILALPMAYTVSAWDWASQDVGPIFWDNKNSSKWYYEAATFIENSCLWLPFETYTYLEPNKPATRQQLINLLYSYDWNWFDGRTAKADGVCTAFSDVRNGTAQAKAAQWGYETGVTNGIGYGLFNPNGKVTREEFVTMVFRFAKAVGVDTYTAGDLAEEFEDNGKVSGWARDAMDWACDIGLINGKTPTMIKPRDYVTRAEMAVIIYRFNDLVIPHDDLMPAEYEGVTVIVVGDDWLPGGANNPLEPAVTEVVRSKLTFDTEAAQ